jgi:predicted DNA-binding protein
MNWVTTNIRLPEDMYMELKMEAAKSRKSVAAVIREKIGERKTKKSQKKNQKDGALLLKRLEKLARDNSKKMKGESLTDTVIRLRYEQ